MVAYEVSKAGVNRLTTSVAQANARQAGIRCNAILPGLMDTPMAVAGIAQGSGQTEQSVRAARNARVPLGAKMGTAWDTAYAALFLARRTRPSSLPAYSCRSTAGCLGDLVSDADNPRPVHVAGGSGSPLERGPQRGGA